MSRSRNPYDPEQVRRFGEATIAYYDRFAREFWHGTRHHDVRQNYTAFLEAIEIAAGSATEIEDRVWWVTLDGSRQFVALARAHSGCEVLYCP